jgi:hypothetical protein
LSKLASPAVSRHGVVLAQIAGEIETRLARHHDVEHDEVERKAAEPGARRRGVAGGGDAKTIFRQVALQQVAQPPVVVDDQDMRRLVAGLLGPRGGRGHGIHARTIR